MAFIANTPALPIANTSAALIATNPIFLKGQMVTETDTNRFKTGDGVSTYTNLTYVEWSYEIVEAAGTDTYTGNFAKPFFLAYFPMMRIRVRFTNANTGAATINLNGLGAKAIKKSVTAALASGDLISGGIYDLTYDGTNFQAESGVGGGGSAFVTSVSDTSTVDLTVAAGVLSAVVIGVKPLVYADGSVPAGNTIANQSGTDVAFASTYTILANTLAVGTVIRIKLQGVYGTAAIAPLITGKLKIGAVTLLTTGALTSIALVSNLGWTAVAELIVTSIGAAGTIESQGFAEFATAATTALSVNMANTAAITSDTTINKALTVTIQWNTSDPANTITLRTMTVDILNV